MRTLLRLWPYVIPVRTRMAGAALVAIVASCLGLVFPLVLKWMVDGPVKDRDTGGIWLGALWLLLLGLAEAGLFGFRRWLVARPLAGVEAAMRADLYRHVQRLPVAFHDRWPSGQLLSRGTTDLMLVRMFLTFPLTFLLVNGVTILVGFVILLKQQWSLGLVLLVPVVPLVILCSVFETKYSLVARRAQDQVGDLTTVVEEGVLGIRIIKGFGRHRSQSLAFRELTGKLRTTELGKAGLLASIWALITTIPEIAIGAALVLGTIQVADGDLSAGTLVAFLSTALALRWPVESIGFLLAMSQESATATARFFEVMDVREEPEAEPGRDGGGEGGGGEDGLRFEGVSFRYPDAGDGLRTRADGDRSAHPARRDDGPGRGDRIRQDDADRARTRGCTSSTRRPDHARRRGHRRDAAPAAARAGVGGVRGADTVLGERRGERPDGRGGRGRRPELRAGAGGGPGRLRGRPARTARAPRSASRG